MPCNIIEIMWYLIAKFNITSVHIIACSGVFVNDLQMFNKKIINVHKKRQSKTDRFYKFNNNRSKNYVVF